MCVCPRCSSLDSFCIFRVSLGRLGTVPPSSLAPSLCTCMSSTPLCKPSLRLCGLRCQRLSLLCLQSLSALPCLSPPRSLFPDVPRLTTSCLTVPSSFPLRPCLLLFIQLVCVCVWGGSYCFLPLRLPAPDCQAPPGSCLTVLSSCPRWFTHSWEPCSSCHTAPSS